MGKSNLVCLTGFTTLRPWNTVKVVSRICPKLRSCQCLSASLSGSGQWRRDTAPGGPQVQCQLSHWARPVPWNSESRTSELDWRVWLELKTKEGSRGREHKLLRVVQFRFCYFLTEIWGKESCHTSVCSLATWGERYRLPGRSTCHRVSSEHTLANVTC